MTRISVEPLRRVEGHGRVDLELEEGRLQSVQVRLDESLRLFEGLVAGRSFSEVPAIVCHICSICSAVHRVAAVTALEAALGVEVPAAARQIRELALLGGHIESHALHLFCLVLPDLAGQDGIIELARAGHPLARAGLEIKRLGNRLQEAAGGRAIHPVTIEVGGVLGVPGPEILTALADDLAACAERLPGLFAPFVDPAVYPFAAPVGAMPVAIPGREELVLEGDALVLGDGRQVAATDYAGLLRERSVGYSNAKHSRAGEQPLLTGALARSELQGTGGSAGPAGIYRNNAAQAHEIALAIRRGEELCRIAAGLSSAAALKTPVRPGAGIGTALFEAPRGLLIHHYILDDFGRVAAADIVTPTAVNQRAMEAQLMADLADLDDPGELRRRAGWIVRAFDPCISCAVHVLNVGERRRGRSGALEPGPESAMLEGNKPGQEVP